MIAQLDYEYIRTRPYKAITRLVSYLLFEGRPITTRGRWINPLVLFHLKILKHMPLTKKVHKPIFIVGCGRSGTTILGKILSLHPEIGFLNEPKAIWHTIFAEEDVFGNYTDRHGRYFLYRSDVTERVREAAHRIFNTFLLITRTRRLLDKYPELIFRVPFVKEIFPDAKFIFIVRNGLATCRSIVAWSSAKSVSKGNKKHDWWGVDGKKWHLLIEDVICKDTYFSNLLEEIQKFESPSDWAVVEWIATMRTGLQQLRNHEASFYFLKYEKLVQEPNTELSQLLRFCELCQDNKLLTCASKVLQPTYHRDYFKINPVLKPLFTDTMRSLGYDV